MKKLWQAIKFWFWWHFRATELDKLNYDLFVYGTAIQKLHNESLDALRVSPMKFFIDPKDKN